MKNNNRTYFKIAVNTKYVFPWSIAFLLLSLHQSFLQSDIK